jgi:hypothetical protein
MVSGWQVGLKAETSAVKKLRAGINDINHDHATAETKANTTALAAAFNALTLPFASYPSSLILQIKTWIEYYVYTLNLLPPPSVKVLTVVRKVEV